MVLDAWLVLIEDPESDEGYRIVANADAYASPRWCCR
jgi:hypothetical protein